MRGTSEPREIDLTPNYKGIFKTMLEELKRQGKAENWFESFSVTREAEALRSIQRFLAPLAIALNAATSVAEIEELRGAVTDVLGDVDRAAAEKERELKEDREI